MSIPQRDQYKTIKPEKIRLFSNIPYGFFFSLLPKKADYPLSRATLRRTDRTDLSATLGKTADSICIPMANSGSSFLVFLYQRFRGADEITAENAVSVLDIDRDSVILVLLEKTRITDDSPGKDKARAVRRLLNVGYGFFEVKRMLDQTGE